MNKQESIVKLLNCIKKDLSIEETNEIIEEMRENRIGAIECVCHNSNEYKEYTKKIIKIEEDIQVESEDNKILWNLLEKHDDLKYQRDALQDKLTYKAGIYDALTFIISLLEIKDIYE